jgi:NADH-quinone oxidoreductase subunit H
MVTAAFLIVILFFGGWHLWGLTGSGNEVTWTTAIMRVLVLSIKVLGVILFFMMARWSWPRFRFDQLMTLSWKVMLPLGLVNLVAVAALVEYQQAGGGTDWPAAAVMWGVAVATWIAAGVIAPLAGDNQPRNVGQVSNLP